MNNVITKTTADFWQDRYWQLQQQYRDLFEMFKKTFEVASNPIIHVSGKPSDIKIK